MPTHVKARRPAALPLGLSLLKAGGRLRMTPRHFTLGASSSDCWKALTTRKAMSTQAITDGRLTIKDIQLEVFHQGTGSKLLLLHGGGGLDHRAKFLGLLAAHFEVIAPSHPGFGHSPLPDRFDSVADLAYLYLDLLDALEARDVILMGFSFGGWVAAEIAVRCAHRLRQVILVAPVGIKVGDRETRDIPDIFATAPDKVAAMMFHDPAKAAVDYGSMTDEELQIVARNRESLALYTWEPYMHNPKLRYQLGRIPIPTLLLRGASDGLVSEQYARAYAALIPNARLEIIPEAGHAPQAEQPDEFVKRVVAFTST
jgi:pimeloyl-ACP methyl ester carboxylesterase